MKYMLSKAITTHGINDPLSLTYVDTRSKKSKVMPVEVGALLYGWPRKKSKLGIEASVLAKVLAETNEKWWECTQDYAHRKVCLVLIVQWS